MRRIALVVVVLLSAGAAWAADGSEGRVTLPGRVSVAMAPGWHVVRQRVSEVVIPIPRLALATFPVRLRRQSCACGLPNISDMPRDGAFILVWEWPGFSHGNLGRYPRLPRRFSVTQGNPHWFECAGPSWTTEFRTSGRVFQVEVWLGRAASARLRARVGATLAGFRAAPG